MDQVLQDNTQLGNNKKVSSDLNMSMNVILVMVVAKTNRFGGLITSGHVVDM